LSRDADHCVDDREGYISDPSHVLDELGSLVDELRDHVRELVDIFRRRPLAIASPTFTKAPLSAPMIFFPFGLSGSR
jgi:hypothetical protein